MQSQWQIEVLRSMCESCWDVTCFMVGYQSNGILASHLVNIFTDEQRFLKANLIQVLIKDWSCIHSHTANTLTKKNQKCAGTGIEHDLVLTRKMPKPQDLYNILFKEWILVCFSYSSGLYYSQIVSTIPWACLIKAVVPCIVALSTPPLSSIEDSAVWGTKSVPVCLNWMSFFLNYWILSVY